MDNPYQSPREPSSMPAAIQRKPSWLRGIAFAIPAFLLGAIIPLLIPATYFLFASISGGDYDSRLFDSALTVPCIGCGVLFSMAAIRHYSPARKTGFVASLMRIGVLAIIGMVFMTLVSLTFDLEPQAYDSDPYLPLRGLLAISIPASYTYLSTRKLMLIPKLEDQNV